MEPGEWMEPPPAPSRMVALQSSTRSSQHVDERSAASPDGQHIEITRERTSTGGTPSATHQQLRHRARTKRAQPDNDGPEDERASKDPDAPGYTHSQWMPDDELVPDDLLVKMTQCVELKKSRRQAALLAANAAELMRAASRCKRAHPNAFMSPCDICMPQWIGSRVCS